jgi:hypothetical protein
VELASSGIHARAEIEGDILGIGATLFRSMADDWSGWIEPKTWESLEGTLRYTATCDRTGHVICSVELRQGLQPTPWKAEVPLTFEAGQLARLSTQVSAFEESLFDAA